jgi:hypothetical protein
VSDRLSRWSGFGDSMILIVSNEETMSVLFLTSAGYNLLGRDPQSDVISISDGGSDSTRFGISNQNSALIHSCDSHDNSQSNDSSKSLGNPESRILLVSNGETKSYSYLISSILTESARYSHFNRKSM